MREVLLDKYAEVYIMGGLLGGRDRDCGGIDDSLLFFFLILVIIFTNCDMFGGRDC